MKFLTVLLISLAVILAQEVTANPVQVRNNNIGDIRVVEIDINGTITNIINQVGWDGVFDGEECIDDGKQQFMKLQLHLLSLFRIDVI